MKNIFIFCFIYFSFIVFSNEIDVIGIVGYQDKNNSMCKLLGMETFVSAGNKVYDMESRKYVVLSGNDVNVTRKFTGNGNNNDENNDEEKVINDEIEKLNINQNKKSENLFRRFEVIFFGSLTFITFFGWITFSAYNSIIYQDTFGVLKRYQFFTLYIGSSILAISVSLSDLFSRLKIKNKVISFY